MIAGIDNSTYDEIEPDVGKIPLEYHILYDKWLCKSSLNTDYNAYTSFFRVLLQR